MRGKQGLKVLTAQVATQFPTFVHRNLKYTELKGVPVLF